MKTSYELIITELFPAARALIAKKLTDSYGLSQKEAAEKLGVTQPAISHYKRNLRGHRNEIFKQNSVLVQQIDEMARKIASEGMKMEVASLELFELFKEYTDHES